MTTTLRTGVTTFTTPSDREIEITRVVDAPRELVFAVHTQPEHLRRWMVGPPGWTMSACEVDLRPGGRMRCVWSGAEGNEMAITGEVREVDPPTRFVNTESWGDDWPESIITLVLTEEEGKTVITTTMLFPSKEVRDAAMETGASDGMDAGYDSLDAYLASLTGPTGA